MIKLKGLASPELLKTVQKYIIDCIYLDERIENHENLNDVQKLTEFNKIFVAEYNRDIYQFGRQKALENYFRGLPSTFNLHYTNHDIINQLIAWGVANENLTDDQYLELADQWWRVLAVKMNHMLNKLDYSEFFDMEFKS